jgi:hypothetical protein
MRIAAVSPSPYWFITRGTGAIALVLLTVTVALGVADVRRTRLPRIPRFVFDSVHRSASLLAVAFVAVHVVTTLLDGFAPISIIDAFVPLHSAYRPIWLGLGAVAFDLLLAVTITSLLRQRLGYRAWRLTHWLAYVSWPVALVHGFGTGSDAKTHWLLVLSAVCVAVMLTAIVARVSAGWPGQLPARVLALGAAAVIPIGLVVWLPSGPLAAGWARRAGTPLSVLAKTAGTTTVAVSTGGAANGAGSASAGGSSSLAGSSAASGTIRQSQLPDGSALVDISLTAAAGELHNVHIRIRGQAAQGGGVQMTTSRVSAGPMANPDQYQGHVTGLNGTTVQATLSDGRGSSVVVVAQLTVPPGSSNVTGTVTTTPSH